MAQSEAQLRASKKYHQKLDNIQVRVPKGEKERIVAHAKLQGESVNAFVCRAMRNTMMQDEKAHPGKDNET